MNPPLSRFARRPSSISTLQRSNDDASDIFLEFGKIRKRLARKYEVAGIFMPWMGQSLLQKRGGVYYVGIGTDGPYGANEPQTFLRRCNYSSTVGNGRRHEHSHTPFWRFLDRLTTELLGGPYHLTCDR